MKLNADAVASDIEQLKKEGLKIIIIGNKSDLFEAMPEQKQHYYLYNDTDRNGNVSWSTLQEKYNVIWVSAQNKQRLNLLKDHLHQTVIDGNLSMDNTIITNARHFQALSKANQSLSEVMNGLDMGITGDFLAQDIRHSLSHLGEITGEIATDDLLDKIFRDFCIGK